MYGELGDIASWEIDFYWGKLNVSIDKKNRLADLTCVSVIA